MTKWNGNPYRPDGGNGGRSEDDGAYFLLPYWLGRYHGLIGECAGQRRHQGIEAHRASDLHCRQS